MTTIRQRLQAFDAGEVPAESGKFELWIYPANIAGVEPFRALVLPRQQTPAEGSVGEYPEVMTPAKGQQIGFDPPLKEVVGRLHHVNGPYSSAALRLGDVEVAQPDEANRPLPPQVKQGVHRVLKWDTGVGPVNLVNINVVGAQPPKALLDFARNAGPAGIPPDPGFLRVPVQPHLRRQDELITPPRLLDPLPDQCL